MRFRARRCILSWLLTALMLLSSFFNIMPSAIASTGTDINPPTWRDAALNASDLAERSLTLTWAGAQDDSGVTGYNIYKNSSVLTTVYGVDTYAVSGLQPVTSYTFAVQALDAAGNESSDGPSISITTEAEILPLNPVSTATDHLGKTITLEFDRAMNDPAGEESQFSVSVDGTAAGISAAASGSDNKQILLYLSRPIGYAATPRTVTVSYTAGNITAADGTVLESFSEQNVTNNIISLELVDYEPVAAETACEDNPSGGKILTYTLKDRMDYDNVNLAIYFSNGFFRNLADNLSHPYVRFYNKDTGEEVALPNILTEPVPYTGTLPNRYMEYTDWYFRQISGRAPLGLALKSCALQPDTTYVVEVLKGFAFHIGLNSNTYKFEFTTTLDSESKPYWAEGSGLSASNANDTGLTLSWPAAEDNHGAAYDNGAVYDDEDDNYRYIPNLSYNIYQDGNFIVTVDEKTTSYDITNLSPGTGYEFKVEAVDYANNHSTCLKTDITTPDSSQQLTPPTLVADNTDIILGNEVDISFTDNLSWRAAINSLTIDNEELAADQYVLTAGNVKIAASALSTVGSHAVVIKALGYADAEVEQSIIAGAAPQVQSADVMPGGDIILTLNKAIVDLSGNSLQSQFTVSVDEANDVVTGVQNSATATGVELILDRKITPFQTVNVSYMKGDNPAGQIQAEDAGILESFGPQGVNNGLLLTPPSLTADSNENYRGYDVDITFNDDSDWRGAITAITVQETVIDPSLYTIIAGNIHIAASAVPAGGTIAVKASGLYYDAAVYQPMKFLYDAPELTADSTDNFAGSYIEIRYSKTGEYSAWSNSINSITVDGIELDSSRYTVVDAPHYLILINPAGSILAAPGTYTIVVTAGGSTDYDFKNTSVTQTILAAPDTSCPVWADGSLTASGVTKTGLTLTWGGASDDVAVTGYRVYQGDTLLTATPVTGVTYNVTGLAAGTQYTFTVQAGDAAGNWSTDGPSATVTTSHSDGGSGGSGDTQAPAWPDNAAVTVGRNQTEATLTWPAAADDTGVAGYRIKRDGIELGSVNSSTTTYTDTGLEQGNNTYVWSVEAFDEAGNYSNAITGQSVPGQNPLSFIAEYSSLTTVDGDNSTDDGPIEGSATVPVSPAIRLYFDRGVTTDAVWGNNQQCITLQDSTGKNVPIDVFRLGSAINENLHYIFLTPKSALTPGETYNIIISKNLTANNGHTLGENNGNKDEAVTFTVAGSPSSPGGGGGASVTTNGPTSTTGSASVDPAVGATVSLGDTARVVIPANALQENGAVTVDIKKVTSPPAIPAGFKVAGDVYEFSVGGKTAYSFGESVALTFQFDASLIGDDEVPAVYYYDQSLNEWVNLGGTVSGSTITVLVDHFTKYAVFAVPKPAAPVYTPAPGTFNDIDGHWAKNKIEELVASGVVSGYPDGSFKPDDTVTRAEFATMLVKAFELAPQSGKVFADTNGHWAEDYIATAAANGLVSGYDSGAFGPDDLITREQIAVMIVKAARLTMTSEETTFTDNSAVSGWAKVSVATMLKNGLMTGYPDNTFQPRGSATRAEAVTVILNTLYHQ